MEGRENQGDSWQFVCDTDDLTKAYRYAKGMLEHWNIYAAQVVEQESGKVTPLPDDVPEDSTLTLTLDTPEAREALAKCYRMLLRWADEARENDQKQPGQTEYEVTR